MHDITYRHYITLLEHIYYINKHQFEIIHERKKEKKGNITDRGISGENDLS